MTIRVLLRELEEAGGAWLPKAVPFWKQKAQPGSKEDNKKQSAKGYPKWMGVAPPKEKSALASLGGSVVVYEPNPKILVVRVPRGGKQKLQLFLQNLALKQVIPPLSGKTYDMAFVSKDAWYAVPGFEKYRPKEKWISAGGVVLDSIDDYKHVWLFKPANNYGPWSFPKGRVDEGESKTKSAVREVLEETGLRARILTGGYLGMYEGGFSKTHFWLMVRTGGSPAAAGWEAEKVKLMTWEDAVKKFTQGGNRRDVKVVNKALDVLEAMAKGK